MRSAVLVVACTLSLVLAHPHDAEACSCVGPRLVFVGPSRIDDAPLSTRVRLEVPAGAQQAQGPVLRVHGGANVDASAGTWTDGSLTFVELTPVKPLQPGTRYEVAVVDAASFPSTTVIGTFKTGTSADTTAPKLQSIGAAIARGNARASGGSCGIRGPWIEVGPLRATDPGRPTAQLMFAVWLGNAAGTVDVSKPPTALIGAYESVATIGQRSLCDPHGFPIPKAPFVWLAIAAVDESGNTSAAKTVRVDLSKATVRP